MQQKKVNIYDMLTERIIESLEQGTVPWKKPWQSAATPRNLITARPYRGINVMLLNALNFPSPYFLSFRQVNNLGGSVKKGEKSCPVIFWKQGEREDPINGEKEKVWLLRYYNVFNLSQCEGIPERIIPVQEEVQANNPIAACKKIIKGMEGAPNVKASNDGAYYVPTTDEIFMPAMKQFRDSESYYVMLYHELVHSTGHEKRLARPEVMEQQKFGSEPYSIEELTGEMGACFLASASGILDLHFENSAAYIAGWLKVFRGDRKFLMKASSQAQKAADYILGTSTVYTDEMPEVGTAVAERD